MLSSNLYWSYKANYQRLTSPLSYGYHCFCVIPSYRRSSHFAIVWLSLLSTVGRSSSLDLSISTSTLGASYHIFTLRCNRRRWRRYRSFFEPNNFWRRLDQHNLLLQFISIVRNPGIHFFISVVRICNTTNIGELYSSKNLISYDCVKSRAIKEINVFIVIVELTLYEHQIHAGLLLPSMMPV